jgi:hypothetical protein
MASSSLVSKCPPSSSSTSMTSTIGWCFQVCSIVGPCSLASPDTQSIPPEPAREEQSLLLKCLGSPNKQQTLMSIKKTKSRQVETRQGRAREPQKFASRTFTTFQQRCHYCGLSEEEEVGACSNTNMINECRPPKIQTLLSSRSSFGWRSTLSMITKWPFGELQAILD